MSQAKYLSVLHNSLSRFQVEVIDLGHRLEDETHLRQELQDKLVRQEMEMMVFKMVIKNIATATVVPFDELVARLTNNDLTVFDSLKNRDVAKKSS